MRLLPKSPRLRTADEPFPTANRRYERWLATVTTVDQRALRHKHEAMRNGPFPFLRATFHRWAQQWPQLCADLADAPVVLSIGDLHVDNFRTWRDGEDRLVWGANDFDEAHPLPFRPAVIAPRALQGRRFSSDSR